MAEHDTLIVLLNPDMKERLKVVAFQERRTMSEVVRNVIGDYLAQRGSIGDVEYRASDE